MSDLVSQSMKIIAETGASMYKDYFSNVNSLLNDAEIIRSSVSKTVKTPMESFRNIVHKGPGRIIMDWFYMKDNETDDDGEEFDPGFKSYDEEDKETSSSNTPSILPDTMRSISEKQMNTLYQIGAKTSEMQAVTSAEIVSSINNNANLSIAAINNVNNTLIGISRKLDAMADSMKNYQQSSEKHWKEDPIIPSDGALKINTLFSNTKQSMGNSLFASLGSMANQMLSSGMFQPSDALQMALEETLMKKKIGPTGKNARQLVSDLNELIGAATHNAVAEILESNKYKSIFGNANKGSSNINYATMISNKYDDKPAMFDNMTRHSIISVIPEYLKKINESLSGKTYDIDERGRLSTNITNSFNKVAKQSFSSSGLSYDTSSILASANKAINPEINSGDITNAAKAIQMTYVMYLHSAGKKFIRFSQLSNDTAVIQSAVRSLVYASGKPESYWTPICMSIMQRLSTNLVEGTKFTQTITQQLNAMTSEAMRFAQSSSPSIANQAGYITDDMANQQFKEYYMDNKNIRPTNSKQQLDAKLKNMSMKDRIKYLKQHNISVFGDNEEEIIKNVNDGNSIQRNERSSSLTIHDYTRGIFGILNRGLNVHVLSKDKPFESYILNHKDDHMADPMIKTPPMMGLTSLNSNDDDKSFISRMRDLLKPSGLRLSQQFFGRNKNRNTDDNIDVSNIMLTDLDDKSTPTAVNKNASSANNVGKGIMNTLQNFLSNKNGNGILDNILGIKSIDEDGVSHRTGGIIQGIGNKAKNAGADLLHDAKNKLLYDKTVHDVKKMGKNKEISSTDMAIAQSVFSMVQSAIADGDTDEDMGAIMKEINSISDENLKNRLKNSVPGMLKRSATSEKIGNSKFGKIATFVIGGIKTVFSPVFKVIRTGILGVTKILGSMFKLIKKGLWSGATDVAGGYMAIGKSLFGSKGRTDAAGNVTEDASTGFIRKLIEKPLGLVVSFTKTAISYTARITKAFYSMAANIAKSGLQMLGMLGSSITEKIKGILPSSIGTGSKKTDGTGTSFLDKIKNSDFGSGVLSGLTEGKQLREKARVAKLKIESVADQKSKEIKEMLDGSHKSVFTSLLDKVQDIFDRLNKKFESEKETGTLASNSSTFGSNYNTNSGTSTMDELNMSSLTANKSNADAPSADNSASSSDSLDMSGLMSNKFKSDTPTTDSSDSDGGSKKKKGIGFDIGKSLGGIMSVLGGIGKIILTVVASLAGFQALIDLVQQVLTEGLEPLNEAFDSIIVAVKPILDITKQMLTTIAESVVTIVESALPMIESLMPLLNIMLDVLKPILELITGVVQVILLPLSGILEHIVVPILGRMGSSLEIIMGILNVGLGNLIAGIGGVISGIGGILKFFTGKGELAASGKAIRATGKDMITQGTESIKSGVASLLESVKDPFAFSTEDTTETVEPEKVEKNVDTTPVTSTGSVMDGIVASGNSYVYNNTYGSGNTTTSQHNYGSYMNMSERGCGPMALAEAYARRSGRSINPLDIATAMKGSGAYSPKSGTSVGSFINTSSRLGMNLRPGGVSVDSLKRATPNNPVTLIGSGSDFGTRSGNNHFINVLGTDKGGMAYVSNPLTGRIDRRPTATLASGSKLGLYGSGDSGYQFSDEVQEAMDSLKSIASNFLSMFTGESTASSLASQKEAADDEAKVKQVKQQLGDDYATYETKAFELFKQSNAKYSGESDAQYQARFNKNKNKYILKASQDEVIARVEKSAGGTLSVAESLLDKLYGENGISSQIDEAVAGIPISPEVQQSSSTSGRSGMFVSDGGAVLATSGYSPTYTDVDATDNIPGTTNSKHSPIHEFFGNMARDVAYTENGGWFALRSSPDRYGTGKYGNTHKGIDINLTHDADGTTPLYPTTDGVVVRSNYVDSCGNNIEWRDNAGMYHWYMHMKDRPLVSEGESVVGGKTLLGHVGNTGYSEGDHLHYQIDDIPNGDGANHVNPLLYFNYQEPASMTASEGKINMTNKLASMNTWDAYKDNPGVPTFIAMSQQVGLTPAQIATIMATGIWEDSGAKIFGAKSLTEVTEDSNGQQAVGIMNWVDTDVSYGDTVGDQLQWIKDTYFSDTTDDYRAKVRENNRSGYSDAFKNMTERDLTLPVASKYGDYMNRDLLEGSTHFFGGAVVPPCFTTNEGLGKYVGTAAGAYNWMLENGYASRADYTEITDKTKSAIDAVNGLFTTGSSSSNIDNMSSTDVHNWLLNNTTVADYLHEKDIKSAQLEEALLGDNVTDEERMMNLSKLLDVPVTSLGSSGSSLSSKSEFQTAIGASTNNNIMKLSGNGDIPDIDPSLFDTDGRLVQYVTNKYDITPNRDFDKERINRILSNTYNVRSERIEDLLQQLIDKIDNKGSTNTVSRSTHQSRGQSMFEERIPNAVTRLSKG